MGAPKRKIPLAERFYPIAGGAGDLPENVVALAGEHIAHHNSIHDLLEHLDNQSLFRVAGFKQGTFAARPAVAENGMFYYATDSGQVSYSTGSAWVSVGGATAAGFYRPQDYNPAAGPAGSAAVNLAAIQAAADAAALAGGGIVFLSPGRWTLASSGGLAAIELEHGVELWGVGMGETVLVQENPNRTDNGNMIRNKAHSTTGSMSAGSKTLTVASATGWKVGGAVQVVAAGPPSAVEPSDDDSLFTRVVAISGNTITLQNAATQAVTNQTVRHGSKGCVIRNLTLDGMRPALSNPDAAPGPAINLIASADWLIDHVELVNIPRSGIGFTIGSTNCHVRNSRIHDWGQVNNGLSFGFAFIVFQGAYFCGIRDSVISGDGTVGVGLDDRTESNTTNDGLIYGCYVENNQFDLVNSGGSNQAAVLIGGTRWCRVNGNRISGAARSIHLTPTQGPTPLPVEFNHITNNMLHNCQWNIQLGILTSKAVSHNVIAGNIFTGTTPREIESHLPVTNRTNVIVGNLHEDDPTGSFNARSGIATEVLPRSRMPAPGADYDGRIIVEDNVYMSDEIKGNTLAGLNCVFATQGVGDPAAGDLILAFVAWTGDNNSTLATPTPSGYTKVREVLSTSGTERPGVVLFSKIAVGNETSLLVTPLPALASLGATMRVLRFPVASLGATPVNASSLTAAVNTSSFIISGVTTTVPNCQVFYFAGNASPGGRSHITTFREISDFLSDPGAGASQVLQVRTQGPAAGSGTATADAAEGTAVFAGITVAIAPATTGDEGPFNMVYFGGGQRFRINGTPF